MPTVLFDLFETLVSECDIAHPSTTEVAQALNLPLHAFEREYRWLQPRRYTGSYPDYAAVLRQIVQRLGGTADDRMLAVLAERRRQAFAAHLGRIEPDILDMLGALTTSGVKIGLISNTDGSEVAAWATSPLAPLVDSTIFSHAVGLLKPDPRIYLYACKHLGVQPIACIYVGDGNSAELVGAAQVGMRPVCATWFLQRHTHVLGADIIVRRAAGFPVVGHPSELVTLVRRVMTDEMAASNTPM